jgi:hypothetical protein
MMTDGQIVRKGTEQLDALVRILVDSVGSIGSRAMDTTLPTLLEAEARVRILGRYLEILRRRAVARELMEPQS